MLGAPCHAAFPREPRAGCIPPAYPRAAGSRTPWCHHTHYCQDQNWRFPLQDYPIQLEAGGHLRFRHCVCSICSGQPVGLLQFCSWALTPGQHIIHLTPEPAEKFTLSRPDMQQTQRHHAACTRHPYLYRHLGPSTEAGKGTIKSNAQSTQSHLPPCHIYIAGGATVGLCSRLHCPSFALH